MARFHSDKSLKKIFISLLVYLMVMALAVPLINIIRIGSSVALSTATSNLVDRSDGLAATHGLAHRGIVSPTNKELKVNTLAFGIPAFLCFILRMLNKLWVMKVFQKEEWFMCITMFFYTSLLVMINLSAHYATNLYPDGETDSILPYPEQVASRVIGSKVVIALEQCMVCTIWGVKICIWMFLQRCCRQVSVYMACLWFLLAYMILGLVVIELSYFFAWCTPFSQYYAVPVINSECATYTKYLITQTVFNLSSDIALILLPILMVCQSHLPLKRRAVLAFVFGLGVFTVISAILNKTYNFLSPFTTVYQVWYIREASVAVMVGNLLCTWQLLQRVFKLRSFDNKDAGIQRSPGNSPLDDDAPTRYTIGGTPYLGNGTPRPNGFRNLWGRRDPDASLFDTLLTTLRGTNHASTVNVAAVEAEPVRAALPVIHEVASPPRRAPASPRISANFNELHPGIGIGIGIDIILPPPSPKVTHSPSLGSIGEETADEIAAQEEAASRHFLRTKLSSLQEEGPASASSSSSSSSSSNESLRDNEENRAALQELDREIEQFRARFANANPNREGL